MKKRFITILCALALVLAAAGSAFAGSFEITKITPKDGNKNAQAMNMAVKVRFSEEVETDEATINKNKDKFAIKDANGNKIPFTMVTSEKYPDEYWLILDETLEADASYTVEIGEGVVSALGNKTTESVTTSFKTRNSKTDSIVSTALMFIMIGAIMFYTTAQEKKKAMEEQPLSVAQAEKLNPYKIAKAKKISLEEAEKFVQKEKEKARKLEEKHAEIQRQKEQLAAEERAALEAEVDSEERRNGWFRVKAKGSFKEHGHDIPKAVKIRYAAKKKAEEERAKKAVKNKKKK